MHPYIYVLPDVCTDLSRIGASTVPKAMLDGRKAPCSCSGRRIAPFSAWIECWRGTRDKHVVRVPDGIFGRDKAILTVNKYRFLKHLVSPVGQLSFLTPVSRLDACGPKEPRSN